MSQPVDSGVSPEYEIFVVGSGEGGKYLAWTMAKQGNASSSLKRNTSAAHVRNIACLPNKNIIHSAKVASHFFRSEEFGISKENVGINMAAVRERKRIRFQLSLAQRRSHGCHVGLNSKAQCFTRDRSVAALRNCFQVNSERWLLLLPRSQPNG